MSRIQVLKDIWQGKSVTRAYLNKRLRVESINGRAIDIGGGKNADYIVFMMRGTNTSLHTFDVKAGEQINFETDALPAIDGTYDTVLFLNVMEHIFNYQHIANEVVRITKPGGVVIGFVPFLMWYHPDHKDFFRYTHEALQKIFLATGCTAVHIESIAPGPFTAAAHMIVQSFPRPVRLFLFLPFLVSDTIFSYYRKDRVPAFALGYFFKLTK